jgi:hypothetical protein
MVSRFLVLSSFVVLRCFTMMASSVGMMFFCFLVVFTSLLRHFAFPPYHCVSVYDDTNLFRFGDNQIHSATLFTQRPSSVKSDELEVNQRHLLASPSRQIQQVSLRSPAT